MKTDWKTAALGGIGGAVLAVAAVFGLSAGGVLPPPSGGDAAIHDYLLAHPAVLIEMSNKLQAQQQASEDSARQAAVDKLGIKPFFDPKLAFVTGPKDAKTTFVEFFDYNCPFCRSSNPAVEAFYNKHKNDVRFAFIEFPIKGPDSTAAARIALAARRQPDKYLALHFALMGLQEHATPAMSSRWRRSSASTSRSSRPTNRTRPSTQPSPPRTALPRPPISMARPPSSSTARYEKVPSTTRR